MTVIKAKTKKMKKKMKKKKPGTMWITMVEMMILHPLTLKTTRTPLGLSSRIQMKKMLHAGVAGVNGNTRDGQLSVNFTSHITKMRKNLLRPLHSKQILQNCWI